VKRHGPRYLIVDDERDICTLIAGILEDEGNTARRAHNSTEAIEAVRQRRPALVILDVWLQGSELDGLQLLDVIRREEQPIPVVMISGHGTIDTAVAAIKSGAYDFIEKPFKADRLLLVVDRAVEADRLRRENQTLRRRAGGEVGFVGSSSAGRRRAQPDRAGGPDRQSRAADRAVGRRKGDRGAADPSRVAARRWTVRRGELLDAAGRAARDRAVRDRQHDRRRFAARLGRLRDGPQRHAVAEGSGRPAAAIAEPLARVLQEQSYMRDGGKVRVEVDVRVLASTVRNLQDEIAAGRFREELFHRLNVVSLRVPPLSERREDIPELGADLLRRVADAMGLAHPDDGRGHAGCAAGP
jgi:two-component system nitrogen regulation response regulator NtrX